MIERAIRPWTLEEFFVWQEGQDERYEFVGGFPLKMMTGASNRHDAVVVNLIVALGSRLRGSGCHPFTADGSIETFPGQIRRPDVGIDCGPRDFDGYRSTNPVVVFEVLSKSTRNFDRFRKIDEYKMLASIQHIVFIEPTWPRVFLWNRRPDEGWSESVLEGLAQVLDLPAVSLSVPLTEIYDGFRFST